MAQNLAFLNITRCGLRTRFQARGMIVMAVTIRSYMQRMFGEVEAKAGQIPGRTSPL
jgi:hypothetical protein